MTPSDLRAAMLELHLSAAGLALSLGRNRNGARTVRRWLAGEHPIPGPVALVVQHMLRDRRAAQP